MGKKSGAKFHFDERALRKAVAGPANEVVAKIAADLQEMLDGLLTTYKGRPVEEIKPVLQSGWQRASGGGDITDPELTEYAGYISAGQRIEFKPGKL